MEWDGFTTLYYRRKLNMHYSEQVKYQEEWERTEIFLAQREKQQYTQPIIPGIQYDRGELKTDDININVIFCHIWSKSL